MIYIQDDVPIYYNKKKSPSLNYVISMNIYCIDTRLLVKLILPGPVDKIVLGDQKVFTERPSRLPRLPHSSLVLDTGIRLRGDRGALGPEVVNRQRVEGKK